MQALIPSWNVRVVVGALGIVTSLGCRSEEGTEPAAEPLPLRGASRPLAEPLERGPGTEESAPKESSKAPEPRVDPVKRPPEADTSALQIRRLLVTSGIENREPLSPAALVADGSPVFAFVELKNVSPQAQQIVVTFEHASGVRVGNVKLEVPAEARRFRTWAQTTRVKIVGEWAAVVRTPEGEELSRVPFSVAG